MWNNIGWTFVCYSVLSKFNYWRHVEYTKIILNTGSKGKKHCFPYCALLDDSNFNRQECILAASNWYVIWTFWKCSTYFPANFIYWSIVAFNFFLWSCFLFYFLLSGPLGNSCLKVLRLRNYTFVWALSKNIACCKWLHLIQRPFSYISATHFHCVCISLDVHIPYVTPSDNTLSKQECFYP